MIVLEKLVSKVEELILMILRQEIFDYAGYIVLNRLDLNQFKTIFWLIRENLQLDQVSCLIWLIHKSILVDLICGALRVENEEGRIFHRLPDTCCERGNNLLCSGNTLRLKFLSVPLLSDTLLSKSGSDVIKHAVKLGEDYGYWFVRVREKLLELFKLLKFLESSLGQVN